jgi:hypothetical protein
MTDRKYEHDGLVISVSKVGTQARISWSGVSDARHPGTFLDPVVAELIEQLKGFEVTVDFTELEYMNSATVSPMLSLVKLLDGNGKPVLVLFADGDWQRTHLKCMTAIARTLQNVKVEGRTMS